MKPTNILIDGLVKIADFGISKLMTIEEPTMTRGIGSQKFMAPEIINEEDHYNEKVDVYSFGVLENPADRSQGVEKAEESGEKQEDSGFSVDETKGKSL